MPGEWTGLQKLTPPERLVLVKAAALMPAVAASLRWRGLKATTRWLEPGTAVRPNSDEGVRLSPDRISRLIDIVARRHPAYRASCLPQSLVLWRYLRQNDYPATLRVGVARRDGQLVGHAWVELEGRVLNDVPTVATQFVQVDLSSPVPFPRV